jgi:hypothetical protein
MPGTQTLLLPSKVRSDFIPGLEFLSLTVSPCVFRYCLPPFGCCQASHGSQTLVQALLEHPVRSPAFKRETFQSWITTLMLMPMATKQNLITTVPTDTG